MRESLLGQKFGYLTPIEIATDYITPKGQHHARWLCQCDCGNQKIILGSHLKSGTTKSCGCKSRELFLQNAIKPNRYDLYQKYGIGYDSNNNKFYFDIEDYDKIKLYHWYVRPQGVVTHIKGKSIKMHRIIMNVTDDNYYIVDHINHNTFDNRKCNLRLVTHNLNMRNKKISSNNKSGYTGVAWDKECGKWLAYIGVNNKQIKLGRFVNIDDAIQARKEAEEKYFGKYSYCNSINLNQEIEVC